MNHFDANQPGPWFNMQAYQYAMFNALQGVELEERGQKYRSWDAAHVIFDPNLPILFNFADRKLNARYAVEEFLWYCHADRFDKTIEDHATAWRKLAQDDGSFSSNYGHYLFAKMGPDGVSMFQFAAEELTRNACSRRAAIPLLETSHCFHSNVDMVCTFAIQFLIRSGHLHMIVNMRSNDIVWGLTNDAFCFAMLHRLMFVALRNGIVTGGDRYPTLRLGAYHHIANSLHVYERHYAMAESIVGADARSVPLIDVPMFTPDEAKDLLSRNATKDTQWTSFLTSLDH